MVEHGVHPFMTHFIVSEQFVVIPLTFIFSPIQQLQEKLQPHAIIPLPSKNFEVRVLKMRIFCDIGVFIIALS